MACLVYLCIGNGRILYKVIYEVLSISSWKS